MRMQTKTWIALAIVFASGAVIGFFGGHAHVRWRVERMRRRGPVALQEFMIKRLEQRLDPSAEQMPTVTSILHQAAIDMDARREQHVAELWESIRESLAMMQPALTAEQRQTLNQMTLEDLLPGPPPESSPAAATDAPPHAAS